MPNHPPSYPVSLSIDWTVASEVLWSRVRQQKIQNIEFHRPAAITGNIVDFFAPAARLVIELDNSFDIKLAAGQLEQRGQYLESLGFKVLRFTSLEILSDLEAVIEKVERIVAQQIQLNCMGTTRMQDPSN